MESQRNPLLSWVYFCQGKSMEELRHSLFYTTVELEQTRLVIQEELRKRDDELNDLKDLLGRAVRERDEVQEKCHSLLLDKLLLQQQILHHQQQQQQQQQQNAPVSGISSIEDEPKRGIDSNNGFTSSDCEESIVSSPIIDPIPHPSQFPPLQLPLPLPLPPPTTTTTPQTIIDIAPEKPLPEKGKLLQAVMNSGPLLQTLLLAGPLPQWRHPPPPLDSFEIPPVTIPYVPPQFPPTQLLHQDSLLSINNCNRKRVMCDGTNSAPEAKNQRLAIH